MILGGTVMTDFYYLNGEQQPVGPMSLEAIRRLADAGIVDSEVLVCPAGEQEWKSLREWIAEGTRPVGPPRVPPPPRPSSMTPALVSATRPEPTQPGLPGWLAPVSTAAGILSLLTTFLPALAFLLAVPAIVGGIVILRRPAATKRGFALASVLTGGVGALPGLLFLVGMIFGSIAPGFVVATEMERALREGIEVGRDAEKRYSDDAAKQSRFIASELQKIDTQGCPPEFRLAFQRNIDAWETAVPYFEANNPGTHFLEGFFGALANDYSGVGFSDYQARLAVENIEATYRDLREIAIAYGASIPTL